MLFAKLKVVCGVLRRCIALLCKYLNHTLLFGQVVDLHVDRGLAALGDFYFFFARVDDHLIIVI